MYDCIIVGMGPAGMSAALYAKRSGMNTLIIDSSAPGGLLNKISIVENYLGVGSISGIDLALKMFEHVRSEEIPYKIETVTSVKNNNDYKTIYTTKGEYKTKTIIFAIGRKPKSSSIVNEEKYKVNYLKVLDIIVVELLISQAIGRWRNFFKSEEYGISVEYKKIVN